MSTNNISEKQIFSYVISTFRYWGIKGISEQSLKQAKKNNSSATKEMKLTLFYLIILHMFDYKIKISDYIASGVKQSEIEEVIMAYLTECECPLLLEMKGQKNENQLQQNQSTTEVQDFVGCNLQSSRQLLILSAWVMAISDYFNQVLPNAIRCRLIKIQNPQVSNKNCQNLIQNKIKQLSKHSNQPCSEQITTLFKSIQAHLYQTDCYKQKKTKLKTRIETSLQKILNTNISLQSLMANTQSQKQSIQQEQLQEIIQNQIQNMNQRKYFWTWLQQKILKQAQTEIKQNNEYFEIHQEDQSNIIYQCQIDLQYLKKYIELCQYYEDKCKQLNNRLNKMALTMKRSKQIEKQVIDQFNSTLNNDKGSVHKRHLFIALQLKSHLNITLQSDNKTKQSVQSDDQKNQQKTLQLSKRLKKQVKKYLNSIESAIKFI